MSRPPELFVRPVSMTEGQRLQRIGRTAKDTGEAAAGDCGADVGTGPECARYRAPAGLLAGAWPRPDQRPRVRPP
jgi:hypothetical protein